MATIRNPHAYAARVLSQRLGGRSERWYARRMAYSRGLLGLTVHNLLTRERHDYPGYKTAYQAGIRRRAREKLTTQAWPF
jgi:hypothetical protein